MTTFSPCLFCWLIIKWHSTSITLQRKQRKEEESLSTLSIVLISWRCIFVKSNRNQFLLFWKHDINQKQVWTKMIPLKSILHTENISVTFYTSNRYLLWQQMSKQPLNCPCVYHRDTKQMSKEWLYEWTLDGAFCKCSGWLDDIFHRQYHDVKVTFSNSLRINKAKTKKMTTVTVVWILDTNYHKILRTLFIFKFFPQFSVLFIWEAISKTTRNVSFDIQTLRSGLKNKGTAKFFNTNFDYSFHISNQ